MKAALLVVIAVAGCSRPAPSPAATPPLTPPSVDSLVLSLPDTTSVWLITGRQGMAADGTTCDEWSIQTRSATGKHLVPLLYTRHAPRLVRGKVIAIQSNHCVDGDAYLIEPATGYPFKQGGSR